MSFPVGPLIRLLRPKQWVKNVFVGAGVFFGAHLHDLQLVVAMGLCFAAFSLMGSSVCTRPSATGRWQAMP
jgi:4-hydroxybenzoate polyprenyltransferase